MVLLTAGWDLASDSPAVIAAVTNFFALNNAFAKQNGTFNQFEYLNYAYQTQSPIQGYGQANVASLKAASLKYDPHQLFQKWVPGGFKLP